MSRQERQYFVYMVTNYTNSVLYTGVTSDLLRRISEHREQRTAGFTKTYNAWKLVYYEVAENVEAAIPCEKQIKAGSRKGKNDLVAEMNPQWRDLYTGLVDL